MRCLWAGGCKEVQQIDVSSWGMYSAHLKLTTGFEVSDNAKSVVAR